ncbi:hypothetical protein CATMIT_02000, partial [Catenibacterium mitsuokai DSM 15897]
EHRVELARVDQRRQRAVLFFHALRTHADLLQVRLVHPHLVAVGDDQLRIGLGVLPAEQPRRRQRNLAGRRFLELAVGVEHLLGELAVQALEAAVRREVVARAGAGGAGEQGRRQRQREGGLADETVHGATPE